MTPARSCRAWTRAATAAGTPRIKRRCPISISETLQPRAMALDAISSPMKPPPDDDDAAPWDEPLAHRQCVPEGAQVKHVLGTRAGQGQGPRTGAGREEQLHERVRRSVVERRRVGGAVDRDGVASRDMRDAVLSELFFGHDRCGDWRVSARHGGFR